MSDRKRILERIKINKPAPSSLSNETIAFPTAASVPLEDFCLNVKAIGGNAIFVESMQEIRADMRRFIEQGQRVINTIEEIDAISEQVNGRMSANELESVDKAYIRGSLGVAENGAVWLDESSMINRILPFICQDLKIVLSEDKIVSNMHEAYKIIHIGSSGYGVFIAGPSKTADIEQSLVIGAHGARSFEVFILKA